MIKAILEHIALELVYLAAKIAPKDTPGGRLILAHAHSLIRHSAERTPLEQLVIGNARYRDTPEGAATYGI